MDLRRLEVFCKAYELGSFSRAAEACLLSQPTVSEHIRTLEEYLGVELFDRGGRKVSPTQGGHLLYSYARRILETRKEAVQALAMFRDQRHGPLDVGGSTIPGQYILPDLIARFRKAQGDIRIKLVVGDTKLVVEAVAAGALELGVVGAVIDRAELAYERIFDDELVIVVPAAHPWADRGAIAFEELTRTPFIMREAGSGTRMTALRLLQAAGLDPSRLQVVAEMGSTEAVRQGIKAGLGVSILSRRAVADAVDCGVLVAVALADCRLHRHFYLITHRRRWLSPLASAFIDFLRRRGGMQVS